jgi:hypothetical protein
MTCKLTVKLYELLSICRIETIWRTGTTLQYQFECCIHGLIGFTAEQIAVHWRVVATRGVMPINLKLLTQRLSLYRNTLKALPPDEIVGNTTRPPKSDQRNAPERITPKIIHQLKFKFRRLASTNEDNRHMSSLAL